MMRVILILTGFLIPVLFGFSDVAVAGTPAETRPAAGIQASAATAAASTAIRAFLADGFGKAHPDAPKELVQFGRLAGLWHVETEMATRSGDFVAGAPGIWAWKYTLDGFAVTDLWFQPEDGLPAYMAALGRDYHLRSNRVFDMAKKQWRVAWMANGAGKSPGMDFGTFHARLAGDAVVMTADDTGGMGLQRVVFSGFTADSFRWSSDFSRDEGKTWSTIMRMTARRIAP
ncbi:hypothetical protein ABI59_11605 [Acidobacteria bacterium Mor1]|nr:hypothetical protein ABI59_11605 [Acidobacteria bacterium Mor1]